MRARSEKGATLVEAAIALPLLLLLMIGIMEFGLAFKDWLTVSHGAREGARAGAAFGNDPASNFLILEEIGGQLSAANIDVQGVRIYNAGTGIGDSYTYLPGAECDWNPCPDPSLPTPPYAQPVWCPASRDITAPETDTIGVTVTYVHSWVTGFITDETNFTTTVEYHIEPQLFDQTPTAIPCT